MNADRLLALGVTQLWQLSLAIAVVGPLAWALARRRPHWAYALWLLVLFKSLTPPLWSSPTGVFSWLTAERVEQPAAVADAFPQAEAIPLAPPAAAGADVLPPAEATPLAPPAVAAPAEAMADFTAQAELPSAETTPTGKTISPVAISTAAVVLCIWAAGAVGMVSIMAAMSLAMLRRLGRGAIEPGAELVRLFADVQSTIGAGRRVQLVVSRERFGPALVGLFRPRVVLPAVLVDGKPAAELIPVLAHELVHLRRGDHLVAHVQLVAQSIWWFHPLVWWMNRQLSRVREMSCDEEVLATLDCEPAQYAQTLLDIVRLRRERREFRAMPLAQSMEPAEFAALRLKHIMSGSLRFHRRTPRAAWAMVALAAVAILPGAGLLAQNPLASDEQPTAGVNAASDRSDAASAGPASAAKGGDDQTGGEALAQTVIDGETHKPVVGAQVTVEHWISPGSGPTVIATTKHVTDEKGRYEIKLPASELEHTTLSLRVAIEQPGYAPPATTDYPVEIYLYLQKQRYFTHFDEIWIYPGEEVTGTIEDPQGKPVAGLPVHFQGMPSMEEQVKLFAFVAEAFGDDDEVNLASTWSRPSPWHDASISSSGVVRTDAQGRFRFLAVKGGHAEFWVEPTGYAVLSKTIGTQRGDIGKTVLEPGVRVTGRVVGADGQPVGSVWVHLVRGRINVPFGAYQDHTSRAAKTDSAGRFDLEPVHLGRFGVSVGASAGQNIWGDGKMPAFFEPMRVSASYGQAETSIEIKAIPHYTIRAHFTDPAGRPFAGGKLFIEGRRPTGDFNLPVDSDSRGLVEARVPRDLDAVVVKTGHDPENVYLRRNARTNELEYDTEVKLGHLGGDVETATFVHFRPATLWFTLVDVDGKPIDKVAPNLKVNINYLTPDGKIGSQGPSPNAAMGGAVWLVTELLPDQEFVLLVESPNYRPETHKLKLSSGESKQLEVVLKPKSNKP